jgi:hypothetical protein
MRIQTKLNVLRLALVFTSTLFFSTQMNNQVYEVMLDLYSPVNVSSVTHTAKGFFVYIKLMKTVTGKLMWTFFHIY